MLLFENKKKKRLTRLVLLALEERKQRSVGHLDNLESDTGNITDGVTRATETSHQHFVVLIAKVQATISYDSENKTWKLKDGSIEKPSTNGCWIYAIHSFEIHDNTIFQLGNSRFKIVYCK